MNPFLPTPPELTPQITSPPVTGTHGVAHAGGAVGDEVRAPIKQLASGAGIGGSGLDAGRAGVAFHTSWVMRNGSRAHTVVASTAPLAKPGWPAMRDRRVDGVPRAGPLKPEVE